MALCRCEKHKPIGRITSYVTFKEPLGYPKTSSICGRKNCNEPGLIWLSKEENVDNRDIYTYKTNVSKVKIK